MIQLTGNYVLTIQTLAGTTVETSTVMDTLFVTKVTLDFTTGAMYADIQRGTMSGSPAVFAANYPPVRVTVNSDGSFVSSDGSWTGSLGNIVPTLVAQLASQFDQFVLASGLVTGTAE